MKTIVFLIALIAFAFAAVEKCTTSSSCNIISPNAPGLIETKRCDGTKCESLKQVTWKTAIVKPDEYCSDSFLGGASCVKFASEGCTPDATNFLYCLPGLTINEGKCAKPSVGTSNTTFVGENEECDVLKDKLCKIGLQCLRGVCRKKLPAGSVCSNAGGLQCMDFHVCDFGKCVKMYSKDEGMEAESGLTCKSGKVKDNICVPVSRSPCYSNADCTDGSVCKRDSFEDDKPGVCINLPHYYQQELTACYASCVVSNFNKAEVDCGCEKIQIKQLCSEQCIKRRDQRYSGSFQYDCKALTATEFSSGQCEIGEQFLNCDAVYSWSGASSLSFGLIYIIAMVLFLF